MSVVGEDRRGRVLPGDRESSVYERLRELIVHGRLAPGSRIIETEIADRLSVSRTPVRSALQRLQQEGYIVSVSSGKQARPMVAPLTQGDAWEVFDIVGGVEGLAGRLAAALGERERAELSSHLEVLYDRLQIEKIGRASCRERGQDAWVCQDHDVTHMYQR